ncbi:MAG: AraC family transcriptional regulator [Pseudomonadota bacterium]
MSAQSLEDDRRFSSFAEFWADGRWAPFVETLHSGKRKPHTLAVHDQPAGEFPDPPMPEFLIILITKGDARIEVTYGGCQFRSQLSPGSIFLTPPETISNYVVDGPQKFISLAVNKDAMARFRDQVAFELPRDFGKLHEQKFHDPVVEMLVVQMLEQATMDHPTGDLFLDQATDTILTRLLYKSGTFQLDQEAPGPLTDHDVANVTSMIEERLEENLNISDLARVTSLSDWHFARAFKQATGLSPHQFVLRRRIARAKDLLERTADPLAEVAVASGFSSQSHMTDVFRQKAGTTPGKYRAEING